jgi:hypothetical protein
MSRLDQHIGLVRSKLTTEKFLSLVGYSVAIFFACVLVAVLVDRFFWVDLPRQMIWFWGSCGLAVVAALVIAMLRRPTPHQAATMIDEKLGLKEKFGTALFARTQGSSDAFVLASIKDAERTADNISLHRRFPLAFPKSSFAAIGAGVVVLLTWTFLGRVDLFDHHKKAEEAHRREIAMAEAKQSAQTAMAVVNSLPKSIQAQQKVELAKQELQHKIDEPPTDPAVIKLTAKTAQEEAAQAAMQEMKNSQSFAQALVDQAMFKSVTPGADDHGPVADASKDIASGNFAKAVEKLQSMGTKFDQMTPEQQDQALQQMKNLAQQMGQIAKDPAAMNKLQQQLKQQGNTQQQIQKATQLAQQAASGNQQAAQQLQQMQQQVMQQMNGGKGPTQQQQQQIAQAMQQMQSVANTQATAQQMTGAAQQMVQGMQVAQSTKAGAAGKGQPGGKGQQASAGNQPGAQQSNGNQTGGQQQGGQQQANSKQGGGQQQGGNQGNQQSGGQQPGGQVAGGNQPGGKQGAGQQPNGGQSGGQNGQNGNGQQQMQQAGQQMADALNQMDAVQKDAEQVAAANNGAGDNGDQGNGTGQKPPGGQGQGGQPNGNHQQGNGQGGAGGVGGWMDKQLAQYTVKQEMDPSQNIANGKILAKSYVKTAQDTGKSTIQLSPAEKATVKESTDEVSEESVPKDAQKAVKEYFDTVGGAADGK